MRRAPCALSGSGQCTGGDRMAAVRAARASTADGGPAAQQAGGRTRAVRPARPAPGVASEVKTQVHPDAGVGLAAGAVAGGERGIDAAAGETDARAVVLRARFSS